MGLSEFTPPTLGLIALDSPLPWRGRTEEPAALLLLLRLAH